MSFSFYNPGPSITIGNDSTMESEIDLGNFVIYFALSEAIFARTDNDRNLLGRVNKGYLIY